MRFFKAFDDWANLALFLVTVFLVGIFGAGTIERTWNFDTVTSDYSLAFATSPNTTCRFMNLNLGCFSGVKNQMDIAGLTFSYLWFNGAYSTTECYDTRYQAYSMRNWDSTVRALSPATQWFAFNRNESILVAFKGAPKITLQATYPADPWNYFVLNLTETLTNYYTLTTTVIGADSADLESIITRIESLERFALNGLNPLTGTLTPYNYDLSNEIKRCTSNVQMQCQVASLELGVDYFLRLVGYATIAQFVFTLLILGQHALKVNGIVGKGGFTACPWGSGGAYSNQP